MDESVEGKGRCHPTAVGAHLCQWPAPGSPFCCALGLFRLLCASDTLIPFSPGEEGWHAGGHGAELGEEVWEAFVRGAWRDLGPGGAPPSQLWEG